MYWRGNGDEISELPAEYSWAAPDGTAVIACHLGLGYGCAASLPADPAEAARQLAPVIERLAARTRSGQVLLMNGSDHLLPDRHTGAVAGALAELTGAEVVRGLLDEFAQGIRGDLPGFSGDLLGARVANLLPGVWSARMPLKLRNRRCESLLEGWAEPWAAIGRALGAPDERPSLRAAWRSLLENQAHDSICGCSKDEVHEGMHARYDEVEELAAETVGRLLERIAGLGPERRVPWTDAIDLAVFNPSPHPRTDLVRFPLEGYPPFGSTGVHPLLLANVDPQGFTLDGLPARLVPAEVAGLRVLPEQTSWEVEFLAHEVPAFGWRRVRLEPGPQSPEEIDDGTQITDGEHAVVAEDGGTFTVHLGDRSFGGLGALESIGDRGDSYDFDPVPGECRIADVRVERRRHESGIQMLEISRVVLVPRLAEDRSRRDGATAPVRVLTQVRLDAGMGRVDLVVQVSNCAEDHRLRMLFPTGEPATTFFAATTFDVTVRSTAHRQASGWVHPAPMTFPHQGWISANGLTVVAPGLPEAEVTPDGTIAITLVRSVGWLSRPDLSTRPGQAGPSLPVPGAQVRGRVTASLALLGAVDPRRARDAELGLKAVAAGDAPLAPPGRSLLWLTPRELVLSAVKPAEETSGLVVRVLNPTPGAIEAVLDLGFPVSGATAVGLDESPSTYQVHLDAGTVRFAVPAKALRSVLLV